MLLRDSNSLNALPFFSQPAVFQSYIRILFDFGRKWVLNFYLEKSVKSSLMTFVVTFLFKIKDRIRNFLLIIMHFTFDIYNIITFWIYFCKWSEIGICMYFLHMDNKFCQHMLCIFVHYVNIYWCDWCNETWMVNI